MIHVLMATLWTALAFTSFAWAEDYCSPGDAEDRAILWEHDNFRGQCLRVKWEIKEFPDGFHDKASSVLVPAGYVLIIWEHSNFRGARFEIHGPARIADLQRNKDENGKPYNWGDCASSAQLKNE